MILQDSVVVIILMSALLCLPPFLALRLLIRYYRRALRLGTDGVRLLLAAVVVLIGFLFNLGVTYGAAVAMTTGGVEIGRVQAVGFAIAWITFWLWIFLSFRIGHHPGRKPDQL